jgi:hypothetical protein
MRMSQRRSCLLPPDVVGCGLVERRDVSIASSLSSAFLYVFVSVELRLVMSEGESTYHAFDIFQQQRKFS